MRLTEHIDDLSDEELEWRAFEARANGTVTKRYLFDLFEDTYCQPEIEQLCPVCDTARVRGTLLVVGEETGNAAECCA